MKPSKKFYNLKELIETLEAIEQEVGSETNVYVSSANEPLTDILVNDESVTLASDSFRYAKPVAINEQNQESL